MRKAITIIVVLGLVIVGVKGVGFFTTAYSIIRDTINHPSEEEAIAAVDEFNAKSKADGYNLHIEVTETAKGLMMEETAELGEMTKAEFREAYEYIENAAQEADSSIGRLPRFAVTATVDNVKLEALVPAFSPETRTRSMEVLDKLGPGISAISVDGVLKVAADGFKTDPVIHLLEGLSSDLWDKLFNVHVGFTGVHGPIEACISAGIPPDGSKLPTEERKQKMLYAVKHYSKLLGELERIDGVNKVWGPELDVMEKPFSKAIRLNGDPTNAEAARTAQGIIDRYNHEHGWKARLNDPPISAS